MEAIFSNLFLLLQAKLQTIATDGGPIFRHIDHDYGQLEDEKPAMSFPAILIDFEQFVWSDMSAGCKMGEGNIILKLVFAPYSGTANITNPVFREKGLQYYELEAKVKAALDGWCPDEATDVYSPLVYNACITGKLRTDVRIREMSFSIGIDDYSGFDSGSTATAVPVITPEIITE